MITKGFISQAGLEQLKNYKYKSGGYTWLDNKMNYFWEWCANLLPTWLAPNLITFIGWIFVIFSYSNMLRYDYTFEKDIPASCFYFAAACIFIYMTLDAIDGKQARKTKSSSPLGQLFDHGCDSFSMTFFILAIGQALKMPKQQIFLLFFASQASLWSANWMEHHTGILRTKVGQFGVTQGQYTCMFFHIITGYFGQNVWKTTIGQLVPFVFSVLPKELSNSFYLQYIQNLQLGTSFVYGYSLMLFSAAIYAYFATLWKAKDERLRAICQWLSFYLIIAMEFVWVNLAIYEKYVGIILVNFGIVTSLIVCKIIISSVTHMKLPFFHNQLIVFLIASILMAYFDLRGQLNEMYTVFWTCFAINILTGLRFIYLFIDQITKFLGIYCFSLKKRPMEVKQE